MAHLPAGLASVRLPLCADGWHLQVRAVPIRKDDEVTVVRGTYKVRLRKLACAEWLG